MFPCNLGNHLSEYTTWCHNPEASPLICFSCSHNFQRKPPTASLVQEVYPDTVQDHVNNEKKSYENKYADVYMTIKINTVV
jgi:hypothetical protein